MTPRSKRTESWSAYSRFRVASAYHRQLLSPLSDHQSWLRERSLCLTGPPNVTDDPGFPDLSNRMPLTNYMNLDWGWLKTAVG